jgi:hypothetical protein
MNKTKKEQPKVKKTAVKVEEIKREVEVIDGDQKVTLTYPDGRTEIHFT